MINTLNISIPVPCVQGKFGKLLATYSTQIPATRIKTVLGHDPRSTNWKNLSASTREIYQQIQRPTSKSRRDAVADYIETRAAHNEIAAFPAISIGITHPCKFEPYQPEGAIGILHLNEDSEVILLDGLGRYTGLMELAEEEGPEGLALVQEIMVPVTFYLPAPGRDPLTIADLGQLFSDFNFRVNPVPARIAIALDQTDPYIRLANRLSKEPFIKDNGGMEYKAASLGNRSTAIVTQSVLVRTVRGACEGRDFQEANLARVPDPKLTDQTFMDELSSIAEFFGAIASRMGLARWINRESLHLSSAGWQALGVIHNDVKHRLTLTAGQEDAIVDVIAGIDWSRSNKEWVDKANLGQWIVPKGGSEPQVVIQGAGRSNTQNIIDFLRDRTGIAAMLKAPEYAKIVDAIERDLAQGATGGSH
jgi:DGQHR domain-containing protein